MHAELFVGLFLGFVVGGIIGGGIAWWIGNSRDEKARTKIADLRGDQADAEARLEETRDQLTQSRSECLTLNGNMRKLEAAWAGAKTRLEEREKQLQEQKALVDRAEVQLSNTFKSLAAQALALNNRGFLDLAEEKLRGLKNETTAELEARKSAIEALVKPVGETLAAYQKVTNQLEEKRQKDMGALGEQLRAVASTQSQLHTETTRLVNALKSPQQRGRWGEIALRKTAELAGMTMHCDFVEQASVATEAGPLRPDMIIKLPADREVVVDSKVPLGGFLEALEATTDDLRASCLAKHAAQLLSHINRLAAKDYWGQFQSLDFVVLLLPNDSFLSAAAENDPGLMEAALSKKIVLASPTTFYALLRAIEYAWRQHTAVEKAHEIRNLGQELSDRFSVLVEHFTKLGTNLGRAVESYNAAVTSFETRILPAARRFKTLGARGRKEIEEVKPVEPRPRDVPVLAEEDCADQ